jgi:hypothetical protein
VAESATIDVSRLDLADQRLVLRFANWIRAISQSPKNYGRFEATAQAGKVETYHDVKTVKRSEF